MDLRLMSGRTSVTEFSSGNKTQKPAAKRRRRLTSMWAWPKQPPNLGGRRQLGPLTQRPQEEEEEEQQGDGGEEGLLGATAAGLDCGDDK